MASNSHHTAHTARKLEGKLESMEAQGEAFIERMVEKSEHLEQKIKEYGDSVDHYIKKNPVKSTIFAGVVGLLIGKLLSK